MSKDEWSTESSNKLHGDSSGVKLADKCGAKSRQPARSPVFDIGRPCVNLAVAQVRVCSNVL